MGDPVGSEEGLEVGGEEEGLEVGRDVTGAASVGDAVGSSVGLRLFGAPGTTRVGLKDGVPIKPEMRGVGEKGMGGLSGQKKCSKNQRQIDRRVLKLLG